MAHEFGHAVQGRVGYPANDTSINTETQADCFAGAWTRWVADGNAAHETIRAPELDGLLAGYFIVRDPPGTGADEDQAHGSYFDRVSAIQDGYDGGAAACRDNYEADRVFTQSEFIDDEDLANDGNADPATVANLIQTALAIYYEDSFPSDLGTDFTARPSSPSTATRPGCLAPDAKAGFCADDDTVYYDESDLAEPAYSEIGDYAVLTAVLIPYGLAAREQLGLSTDDEDAIRSATCQAGAFSGAALLQRGDRRHRRHHHLPRRLRRGRHLPAHLRQGPDGLPRRRPVGLPAGRRLPAGLPVRPDVLRAGGLTGRPQKRAADS